jgi:hypothetical protein
MRFLYLTLSVFMLSCVNPFAPGLDRNTEEIELLQDQRTIEGVFQNFRYAYVFKDTVVYSRLLDENFVFVYRDYDKGQDISWGKVDEMRATYGLFRNTQNLDLIWNNIIVDSGDSLYRNVVRSFNLTITFNPADIVRIDGRANFILQRRTPEEPWLIAFWRDESNY